MDDRKRVRSMQIAIGAIFAIPGLIAFLAPSAFEDRLFISPSHLMENVFSMKLFGIGAMELGAYLLTTTMRKAGYSYFSLATLPIIYILYHCIAISPILGSYGPLLLLAMGAVFFMGNYLSLSKNHLYVRPQSSQTWMTYAFRIVLLNVLFIRGFWSLKNPYQVLEIIFTEPTISDQNSFLILAYGAMEALLSIALIFGRLDADCRLCLSGVLLFRGWWESNVANDGPFTMYLKVTWVMIS